MENQCQELNPQQLLETQGGQLTISPIRGPILWPPITLPIIRPIGPIIPHPRLPLV